jgi:hypothetical protein
MIEIGFGAPLAVPQSGGAFKIPELLHAQPLLVDPALQTTKPAGSFVPLLQ